MIVNKFPAEGKNMLQTYYDACRTREMDGNNKQGVNLLLRAQDYIAAGSNLARRALYNAASEGEERTLSKVKYVTWDIERRNTWGWFCFCFF